MTQKDKELIFDNVSDWIKVVDSLDDEHRRESPFRGEQNEHGHFIVTVPSQPPGLLAAVTSRITELNISLLS